MTSSIYTNTGIVESSWNSRGLVLHNAINKSLIVEDNGTLWAAVRENHPEKWINIYRSTDNGFSWQNMYRGNFNDTNRRTGVSGLNTNGPTIHLTYNEELQKLILWHSFYEQAYNRYDIETFVFNVTDTAITRPPMTGTGSDPTVTETIVTDQDELFFDISYTDNGIFLVYSSYSQINCQFFRHSYQVSPDGGVQATVTDDFFSLLATCAKNDDKVDILAIRDLGSEYQLVHLNYDRLTGGFSSNHIIQTIPLADMVDLNIERDAFDNLCAFWSERNSADTTVNEYYSISTNNGISWSEPHLVPQTIGQGDFRDGATNQLSGRTILMAGLQGFILGYVRTQNGKANAYVRLLTTTNGSEYELQEQKVAASEIAENVTGIRFFRPVGRSLVNLDNAGEIRIAFNVGNSTTTIQVDRDPNYFGQKLLKDEAFVPSTTIEYNPDTAMENQLLFNFNLLGSTLENVDYFAEGLTGPLTNKYVSAFDRFGTSIYIEKYEPLAASYLGDKSAYTLEETWYTKAFFQDINYSFPAPSSSESFDQYIERDMRKLHLPPDFHLDRTFLINKGNKLKRTVWIARFDGNDYELSQVVPKFVDNQIVYYTVNAYVIGPSRNPFTRTILPSET